ncbi:RNA-directed DNA polymerase from mobile element jockey [Trichonephila clavipes]|nr:RNA-directed DNA polymerase from mobile element jockey [Trichonephila clavipes]
MTNRTKYTTRNDVLVERVITYPSSSAFLHPSTPVTISCSSRTGHACSHPQVLRAHKAGLSRRSLAGVGLSESVRCHGPDLVLLTNGGMQQQQKSSSQASAAVTHLKKLHVFQNKHLRKITNAPWFVRNEILHKDLKIDPILDFIKNQSKKFSDRLLQIPNQSIRVIPAYDNSIPSSAKRPRAALHHIYQHFPVLKRLRIS